MPRGSYGKMLLLCVGVCVLSILKKKLPKDSVRFLAFGESHGLFYRGWPQPLVIRNGAPKFRNVES